MYVYLDVNVFVSEVNETLGFETESETRVVSVSVSELETRPLKAESQSQF